MNCLSCKTGTLLARVSAILMAPLAQRGGSIAMKGVAVKQTEIKDWWDKDLVGDKRMIRGPIICADCDAEHVYLCGLQPSLRLMMHDEAKALGYAHFAATSEKSTEDDNE